MFNEITIVGRLGRDPELRTTQNGLSVCTMNAATSHYQGRGDQCQERTEWHTVVVFGAQAEPCHKFLAKGSMLLAKGRLQSREYEDKQGVKRRAYEIVADTVRFLDPKNKNTIDSKTKENMKESDLEGVPF